LREIGVLASEDIDQATEIRFRDMHRDESTLMVVDFQTGGCRERIKSGLEADDIFCSCLDLDECVIGVLKYRAWSVDQWVVSRRPVLD
jgi:hypothetical protein